MDFILKASLFSILLNVVAAQIATPYATPDEVKPPEGAAKLKFRSQIMHMLVHHNQVLVASSLIVFGVTYLSVYLAKKY